MIIPGQFWTDSGDLMDCDAIHQVCRLAVNGSDLRRALIYGVFSTLPIDSSSDSDSVFGYATST